MDGNAVIKSLLSLGISALGKLIPALGGFIGGPFGFIATLAISWLSGILYDMVERMARFAKIDSQAQKDLSDAKSAGADLKKVQEDPATTKEEREKAISAFADRVRALGKFRL